MRARDRRVACAPHAAGLPKFRRRPRERPPPKFRRRPAGLGGPARAASLLRAPPPAQPARHACVNNRHPISASPCVGWTLLELSNRSAPLLVFCLFATHPADTLVPCHSTQSFLISVIKRISMQIPFKPEPTARSCMMHPRCRSHTDLEQNFCPVMLTAVCIALYHQLQWNSFCIYPCSKAQVPPGRL